MPRHEQGLQIVRLIEKRGYAARRFAANANFAANRLMTAQSIGTAGQYRDPTRRILVACDFGRISTLAAATLRELGYTKAAAPDGGIKAWRERATDDGALAYSRPMSAMRQSSHCRVAELATRLPDREDLPFPAVQNRVMIDCG